MADREKVIRALENCTDEIKCRDCPWETCETFCLSVKVPLDLAKAALSLLKAQEPKTVKEMLVVGGHLMGKCPRCCKILTVQDHPIACGFCGQAVKWDG